MNDGVVCHDWEVLLMSACMDRGMCVRVKCMVLCEFLHFCMCMAFLCFGNIDGQAQTYRDTRTYTNKQTCPNACTQLDIDVFRPKGSHFNGRVVTVILQHHMSGKKRKNVYIKTREQPCLRILSVGA